MFQLVARRRMGRGELRGHMQEDDTKFHCSIIVCNSRNCLIQERIELRKRMGQTMLACMILHHRPQHSTGSWDTVASIYFTRARRAGSKHCADSRAARSETRHNFFHACLHHTQWPQYDDTIQPGGDHKNCAHESPN